MYITQPISSVLKKPEQPIREAGKFEILRHLMPCANSYCSGIGSESKRKKKEWIKKEIKSVHIGYSD